MISTIFLATSVTKKLDHNTWYYLNPDGDMKIGWLYDKNIWYYLNNDGSMAVNRSQDGWYLGADGAGRKE